MSDVQALIEEARGYIHPDSAHALYLIGCLADALEAENATREALRAKVNALADELHESGTREGAVYGPISIYLSIAHRLRSLVPQEGPTRETF